MEGNIAGELLDPIEGAVGGVGFGFGLGETEFEAADLAFFLAAQEGIAFLFVGFEGFVQGLELAFFFLEGPAVDGFEAGLSFIERGG